MRDSHGRVTRAEFLRMAAAAAGTAALSPAKLLSDVGESESLVNYADTVLLGGRIVTMEAGRPVAEALAVRGGLVQAVASDAAIGALIGPETFQIDLRGRTVTPGFVDSHLHLQVVPMYGTYYVPLMPPAVISLATLQAELAKYAAGLEPDAWVIAAFLTAGADGIPDRWDLDAACADKPVFLLQQAGHMGTVNSRALEIAGISASTPNPPGGIIERGAGGEPTGVLYNHRALDLVRRHMPQYSDEDIRAGIPQALSLFASFGVTTFHDNNVRGTDSLADYQQVAREGNLSLRATLYFTCEYPADVGTALNSLPQYEDAFCRTAGAKFLIDGQMPTAFCHEPHNGISWQTTTWDPAAFKSAVRALHAAGHQISVHCVGDAATDLTLEAYEEAMNAYPRANPRHRLEHCIVTKRESTQRMKDLGVVVSTQPAFLRVSGDVWRSILGEERMDRILMVREWMDAGVAVALSSDAPTIPWYSPQVSMAAALDRKTYSGNIIGDDQALTIHEALRAYTLGGAFACHQEDSRGTLVAGKLADFIVWTADPYHMTPEELQWARVDYTFVGGRIVHPLVHAPRRRLSRR